MKSASRVETESLARFFLAAGRLKRESRMGWKKKLHIERPESVADHSYRVAVLAIVYADVRGLDVARTVKMALIHDLPEALVGDSVPGEQSRARKTARESEAMHKLIEYLHPRLRREYEGIWSEFLANQTPEARLVHQLDRLEMGIQATEYIQEGYSKRRLREFLDSAEESLVDRELIAMLQAGVRMSDKHSRRRRCTLRDASIAPYHRTRNADSPGSSSSRRND